MRQMDGINDMGGEPTIEEPAIEPAAPADDKPAGSVKFCFIKLPNDKYYVYKEGEESHEEIEGQEAALLELVRLDQLAPVGGDEDAHFQAGAKEENHDAGY